MKLITNLLFYLSVTVGSGLELDYGIAAYEKRAEESVGLKANPKHINEAIRHFHQAVKISEWEEEASVFLLKSYYYKGTYVLENEEKRKIEYNKGKALAEKMIIKYPDSAPLRYWYLTCLGKWSEVYGILTAAKEGVADIMKEQSEMIIELDPEYENGGGYFMLGAVHFKSPYIPFILSWPDNDVAVHWLKKANDTGSATSVQKNYLARALAKDGKKSEAITLVKGVISKLPDRKNLVEERFEIEKAKQLLTEFE